MADFLTPLLRDAYSRLPAAERVVVDNLMRDPLVVRRIKRVSDSPAVPTYGSLGLRTGEAVRGPLDVLGEQRAFAMLHIVLGRAKVSEVLLRAVPYLWLNEIDEMASALPIPTHIVSPDLLPFPAMWWTFEGAHPMTDGSGQPVGLADGFLVHQHQGGWIEVDVLGNDAAGMPQAGRAASFRAGWRWPADFPENERPTAASVLARLSFLASPFVEAAIVRPHTSKRSALGRSKAELPAIRFVRLRAAAVASIPSDKDSGSVAWKHRWIVRGHHRAQWYPSIQAHRLVWIGPYMKGPADAPLKTPMYVVNR
jgi:hypothetical protein